MQQRFGRETWSLVVPPKWRGSHESDFATVAADAGVGALQVSAAFKGATVSDDDLRDFAVDHLEGGATSLQVQLGDFSGLGFQFSDGECWWRQWYLRNGEQLLFVTYNCPVSDRGAEDAVVDQALSSLSAAGVPQ